jgi:hypothetical protein
MTLTMGGVAALAFAIALTLMFKKIAKKLIPWLMLVAGIGLGGVIGSLSDRLVNGTVDGISRAAGSLLGGTAVGGLIVIAVLTILLVPHMKPKGQPPTRFTPWLAFIFPAALVAVGGMFSTLAGLSENVVTQAAGALMTTAAAIIGGF